MVTTPRDFFDSLETWWFSNRDVTRIHVLTQNYVYPRMLAHVKSHGFFSFGECLIASIKSQQITQSWLWYQRIFSGIFAPQVLFRDFFRGFFGLDSRFTHPYSWVSFFCSAATLKIQLKPSCTREEPIQHKRLKNKTKNALHPKKGESQWGRILYLLGWCHTKTYKNTVD